MKNLISIVIPTYNREKKLHRAVLSIIEQSFTNWELIIVDNCSDDSSEKLINSLGCNKIFFYKINNNGIIAKSRNFGISKSNGNYICFLDSDDWWHKDKLYFLNRYISKNYDLIFHDMFLTPSTLLKKKTSYCRRLFAPVFEDLLENGPAFPTSSVCVKKKVIQDCGGFNENPDFLAWEDYDTWLRISKMTDKFFKIPKSLGFLTVDNENFLSDEISIKNIFSFKENYYFNKKLPNWALFSLIRSYYRINDFKNSSLYLNQLNIIKLNFKLFLRFLLFKLILSVKNLK